MPVNPAAAAAIIRNHVCGRLDAETQMVLKDINDLSDSDWEQFPDLPSSAEILAQADSEQLPWFPIKHEWKSKKDYLKALYLILRFEGVEGLRYSVHTLRERPSMSDDDGTCIYTKMRIQGYLFTKLGPIARVSFSIQRAGVKIKWKQSQRLQPGKIVALSRDFFKTDCRVAVVAQRPIEGGLDQNPPLVDLFWANPTNDALVEPDQELVMVESRNGYYEAVRHSLKGLQLAAQEWCPLDKCVVGLDRSDPTYPTNIRKIDYSSLVDHLTPDQLLAGDKKAQQQAFRETEDRFKEMPRQSTSNLKALKPYTSLDESQLRAFERIVTKELAIVQGPPGTGKTFTSVKSITIILKNRQPDDPPIIVSAQTNHALDQLLIYCKSAGANIMRVGGRTENEEIAKRTMYELRIAARLGGQVPSLESQRLKIVTRFEGLVNGVFGGTELLDPQTLLDAGVITETQYKSMSDDEWEGNEDRPAMDTWLGEDKIDRVSQLMEDLDFDEYEVEADDVMELGTNLNDDQVEDDDDRIYGKWVPLSSQHTGRKPQIANWESRCRALLVKNDNLYDIPVGYRGGVYQAMEKKLREATADKFRGLLEEAAKHALDYKAACWTRDLGIIDRHCIDIVGCTTTGLTKYRGLLAAFQPRVLLIEEAAETREANIASALFPSLQQLILVGDHQQLPPSCDVARLGGGNLNLNVSMFERLVANDMPYTMLDLQRRMAPELRYIVQKFYPKLRDHPLVSQPSARPLIPGLGHRRSWFFTHQWPEDTDADNSKFNQAEAEMVVAFIRYLLHNNVKASEITVLTYYKGQKRKLLQRLRQKDIPIGNYFNVATVDSYQGEENEIIILSLVRSPSVGRDFNVGFLDSPNRATVAISRARRGFFMFGNKENLLHASKESFTTWAPIWNGFAEQYRVAMSKGLPLVCQNHKREIWVKESDDLVGNAGGCWQKCDGKLNCGHACVLMCHNITHNKLPCLHACTKTLECGHKCAGFCSDPCRCAINCPEYLRLRLEMQLAEAQAQTQARFEELEARRPGPGDLRGPSPEAMAMLRLTGSGSGTPSSNEWQDLANNPEAHDGAIRAEKRRIMGDDKAVEVTLQRAFGNIQETFIVVSDKDGRRVRGGRQNTDVREESRQRQAVAANKKTNTGVGSARSTMSGDARQLSPRPQLSTDHAGRRGQGQNRRGLGGGPASTSRDGHQNVQNSHGGNGTSRPLARPVPIGPRTVNTPDARATQHLRSETWGASSTGRAQPNSHTQEGTFQAVLSHTYQQQDTFDDNESVVSAMGFEAETRQAIQRQRPVPSRQAQHAPRAQRIQPVQAESLIEFGDDTPAMVSGAQQHGEEDKEGPDDLLLDL